MFIYPTSTGENRPSHSSTCSDRSSRSSEAKLFGIEFSNLHVSKEDSVRPWCHRLESQLFGRPWKDISGMEPAGGVSNYQDPADVKSWIVNVPRYERVKVANVYEGIDLILYTHGDNLEYDFVVGPGADPKQVQVVFEGMKGIRVDKKSGDLVLTAPDGSELRQFRPNVCSKWKRLGCVSGPRENHS